MAVVDIYTDALLEAGKLTTSTFAEGGHPFTIVAIAEPANADDDGSVFRLAKALNPDLIPVKFELYNDTGMTGSIDWELGFYETSVDGVDGIAIDIDALLGTTDLSSANARGSAVDALGAVDLADGQKRLYELAGDTQANKRLGYDIALTANDIGTVGGTILVVMTFVQG